MAGIPTEHLADQIRETNQRLSESHERLSDEVHDLNHKFDDLNHKFDDLNHKFDDLNHKFDDLNHSFVDLNHKFDDYRVEIAEKLGAINTNLEAKLGAINANLEGFRSRTETSFRVAIWGISVASTVAIAMIGSVIAVTWYAAKLDSRVERVESRLDKELPALKRPQDR